MGVNVKRQNHMNFDDWVKTVPSGITGDSLWKMRAYQLALFAADVGWNDVTKLARDHRTQSLSDQLYRSLGSIGANLAEGYSYGTGPNRARMYEYSLGSARESRDWYYKGRHILSPEVTAHRIAFMSRIVQLLLVTVPDQRGKVLRENNAMYEVEIQSPEVNDFEILPSLDQLLMNAPIIDV